MASNEQLGSVSGNGVSSWVGGTLLPSSPSASRHTSMVVTDPRQSQLEKTRTKIIGKTEKIPAQNGNSISLQLKEGRRFIKEGNEHVGAVPLGIKHSWLPRRVLCVSL